MKIAQIKNDLLNWRKLSLQKIAKYVGLIIGSIILLCVLIFVFIPDPFINSLLKNRITKALTEAYPADSIKFGDLHYSVWQNRLGCDSISLKTGDSTLSCNVASVSVGGINWMKILWNRDFTLNDITSSVINARKIVFDFRKSQDELRIGMLHISVPDSELVTDSIKYYSLIGNEQFFAKSEFRQTIFHFNIPQMGIVGLDYLSLLKGNIYKARSISIYNMFADILVNMDKPYDINSSNPEMPNEVLSSMKETVNIDSLIIINGQLKYRERFGVEATPGIVTFKKVNVFVRGISNNKIRPDTTIIHGEGLFMDSGKMKLDMAIPLATKDFSLRYSGSLSTMDVTTLNTFIEPSEHQRIKSGVLQSASFNINVNSGYASGTLNVIYKDVSIVLLDENTGSEKGVFNQILSLFGKIFIIRGSNIPDEEGLIKIGEIKYTRKPADYFFQFLWFALRGGVADVLGFPRE
jgi:hypothetical protein